jgi:hypothetical protein
MAEPKKERRRQLFAPPTEVANFASGLTISYLLCRDLGHNWRPFGAQYNPDGYYERVLRCTRCRTERWETLSVSGAKVGGQYKYPEGYQRKGFGRIVGEGRDALRLESIMRAVGERAEIEE